MLEHLPLCYFHLFYHQNQTLKNNKFHWICSIPALFMTAVVSTYWFYAPEGFNLSYGISLILGMVIWLAVLAWFVRQLIKHKAAGNYEDSDVKAG